METKPIKIKLGNKKGKNIIKINSSKYLFSYTQYNIESENILIVKIKKRTVFE